MRQREIKFIACARDGDIKQTPLFLERIARVERAAARKHSVGQPNHEHRVKLETFGLVHRGKIDCFLVAGLVRRRFRVDIADERQLRKKFVYVLKPARKKRELIEVFAPQFVVCEVHLRVVIVDGFDHRPDHLGWRVGLPRRCDFVQRVGKLFPHFF